MIVDGGTEIHSGNKLWKKTFQEKEKEQASSLKAASESFEGISILPEL